MRVAIVTESFFPQVNGVTNSVRHVVDRLLERGHEVLLVAPAPGLAVYRSVPVVRVRSVAMPGYRTFPVGLPDRAVERALADFRPDVVHLASPIALGAVGLRASRRLGVPAVAVYQTDIGGFARQYGVRAEAAVGRWVGRIHRRADRTLVPSTASRDQLAGLGVTDLHLWRRGVALGLFGPQRRVPELNARWTRHEPGSLAVGYVGRLAPEKQVARLPELASLGGIRLVVVGDGPSRASLERQLPAAKFTGMLRGQDLAQVFASLDVFVHTGQAETFCQTIQEAQASGVPVVAPAAGGPLDLVDHGRTGLLYDPAAPGSLRDTVARLVGDHELRRTLGAAGPAAVRNRTWATVVDELIDVHYPAVLPGNRTALAA
ncbi:glycosyltransferase family 1 protein [Nocardioides seonyuensis]|uniref:Glycosyltransferase family 1 protein n=1 Tax=Nocardioides seonyuensis TaxID=2518371 RepID=A0A4P7IBP7_9ACTN|nr:glycosyltransferase family 1 protein [Nocardioides seonyuensis]QBX54494.1 glycosyltransferase family 1 protein [Nocardioides seonyuensis]